MLKHNAIASDAAHHQRQSVLTKAVLSAADIMDLRQSLIAKTLGISESSVSRMRTGHYLLREGYKEWELASLLVRLYRGLDAIAGGDEDTLRSWLQGYNTDLAETPINLITHVAGLTRTVDYVDAFRARA